MQFTRRAAIAGVAAAGAAALAQTQAFAAPKRQSPMLDAIVLGAGVSGLNTAWLLEQQGLRVLTLEARQRVGGRVFTLMDQPGRPEMGFNSMSAGYGRGIDAAKRAKVELVDLSPRYRAGAEQQLAVNGELLTRAAWASSPRNPFPAAYKNMMPWEITFALFSSKNPLPNWADWTAPANAKLDVSVHDFLAAQGLNDEAIRLALDVAPYHGSSSYDASAISYEFVDGWNKSQASAGPQSFGVKGGNELLPKAMAGSLRSDVLLGKEVVSIVSDKTSATVTCRDSSSYTARRVICSLPFSTLRTISISPGLTSLQSEAIATLPYQAISIAFITVKSPFWEKDGMPPSMWTDGPLGAVIAQRFGATESDVTGLSVYARGNLARYWDRLGKDASLKLIVSELERLRPAARGQVSAAVMHSWSMEPFSAGAWGYFAPGQITRFAKVMAAPAGRLYFCGEHTAVSNRGLEGALESSERVALEVLGA